MPDTRNHGWGQALQLCVLSLLISHARCHLFYSCGQRMDCQLGQHAQLGCVGVDAAGGRGGVAVPRGYMKYDMAATTSIPSVQVHAQAYYRAAQRAEPLLYARLQSRTHLQRSSRPSQRRPPMGWRATGWPGSSGTGGASPCPPATESIHMGGAAVGRLWPVDDRLSRRHSHTFNSPRGRGWQEGRSRPPSSKHMLAGSAP